jgi:hypothetical protein
MKKNLKGSGASPQHDTGFIGEVWSAMCYAKELKSKVGGKKGHGISNANIQVYDKSLSTLPLVSNFLCILLLLTLVLTLD